MSDLPFRLQCVNPLCLHPDNAFGQERCDRCQTPLVYRYLSPLEPIAADLLAGAVVNERYAVLSPQLWFDTQPAEPPDVPMDWSETYLPYLQLYPQRLHVPQLFGFCQLSETEPPIALLDNIPVDAIGNRHPTLEAVWSQTTSVRQLYWLWQMLQLWTPFYERGVATSLLDPINIRVEGWRIRLQTLISDHKTKPSLQDLAALWRQWGTNAAAIAPLLEEINQQFQAIDPTDPEANQTVPAAVMAQFNQHLLAQAGQQPLGLEIAGASTTGPQRLHNEDACYPLGSPDLEDPLQPFVGIICDGIGGHEGGEVASQLALDSLQLQLKALLKELVAQPEPVPPEVVEQHLTAVIRVANNLIADRNNTQGRESRRRMGTTLVMAIQLPQKVKTPSGLRNTHELYLAHVGDSRAYWLTPDYCHPLTVDDDVATREVSLGRSLYHEALQRPDAGALTQALGTRDAQLLRPTVRRFVLEENGLLLLCSDGLSDHDWVERAWPYTTRKVLQGEMTLAEGVQAWIDLANQHNGHDNTSVVLLRCLVTGSPDGLSTSFSTASSSLPTVRGTEPSQSALATDSTTSTKKLDQLLMGPASAPSQAVASRDKSSWSTSRLASIVGVVLAIAVGLVLWQWRTIQQTWRSLFPVDASDAVFPPAAGAASVRASVTADEDVKP